MSIELLKLKDSPVTQCKDSLFYISPSVKVFMLVSLRAKAGRASQPPFDRLSELVRAKDVTTKHIQVALNLSKNRSS